MRGKIPETLFLLQLEKCDVLRFERVDSILNLANVAISLFFASLLNAISQASFVVRETRNFSRLEGIAVVCFE